MMAIKSHTAAACGSFKSFLLPSPLPGDRESHIAAACGSFMSFLHSRALTTIRESHTAAACGSFKSSLPPGIRPEDGESHTAAACGSFKSFLLHKPSTRRSRIPHRGSVWIVQVLSTYTTTPMQFRNPTPVSYTHLQPTRL